MFQKFVAFLSVVPWRIASFNVFLYEKIDIAIRDNWR